MNFALSSQEQVLNPNLLTLMLPIDGIEAAEVQNCGVVTLDGVAPASTCCGAPVLEPCFCLVWLCYWT